MKKITQNIIGICIGLINILIGACGGIVAVEALKKSGSDQTQAHSTAIAVILPITIISASIYLYEGKVDLSQAYLYLLPGLIGSAIGAFLLPKISKKFLSKIFSFFMIYAGIRMMLK